MTQHGAQIHIGLTNVILTGKNGIVLREEEKHVLMAQHVFREVLTSLTLFF